MTPESFCSWLTGYLSSIPEPGHPSLSRIRDTLEGVSSPVLMPKRRDSEFFSTAPHNVD